MREKLHDGKINSVTISRRADRWFASVQLELPDSSTLKRPLKEKSVGIDLGIHHFAVTSDGLKFPNTHPLGKLLRKLKLAQRQLSKKARGVLEKLGDATFQEKGIALSLSKNYQKQKVAKIHAKIYNRRTDYLHKLTTYFATNYTEIHIEDLNVLGMIKNHNLALALTDVGMGRFREMLTYKTKDLGTNLVKVGRFFGSSKICSKCGRKKEKMSLRERVYSCQCGNWEDRDYNAAKNIEKCLQVGKVIPDPLMPVEIEKIRRSVYPIRVDLISEAGNETTGPVWLTG
jgi:putative transposase